VQVYDYNGAPGDDFRLYFNEQRPGFVVPYTGDIQADPGYARLGAPVRGLTNEQCWQGYRLAIAGAVAPADAGTRTGIDGLIGPLTDPKADSAPPPASGNSRGQSAGLASLVPAPATVLHVYDYNQHRGDGAPPPSTGLDNGSAAAAARPRHTPPHPPRPHPAQSPAAGQQPRVVGDAVESQRVESRKRPA